MRSSLNTTDVVCSYLIAVGNSAGNSSSAAYLHLNRHMSIGISLHQQILTELERQGILTVCNHWLKLTDKGMRLHNDIAEILLEAAAKREGAR